jgi:hypothetical protein
MTHSNFFANFFVVDDPDSKKNFRGQIKNQIDDFVRLLREESNIDHLDIEYLEGASEPSNLFWNMVTEPFCINQATVDILKQSSLSGWSIIPVTVKNKFGAILADNYFAMTVHGRTNPIDYLKRDIVIKQMAGGKFPYFKGLYFDPESWDGSDIFMTKADVDGKKTAFIYVTKKFVDTFKKHKIANISFENFNDFEIDCFAIQVSATDELKKKIEDKINKVSS